VAVNGITEEGATYLKQTGDEAGAKAVEMMISTHREERKKSVCGVDTAVSHKYLGLEVSRSMFDTYRNQIARCKKQATRFSAALGKGEHLLHQRVFATYMDSALRYFVAPVLAANNALSKTGAKGASKRINTDAVLEDLVILLKICHGFPQNTPQEFIKIMAIIYTSEIMAEIAISAERLEMKV
jgi:hypothetical protein